VAQVVEASLTARGDAQVHRVSCVIDCGQVVNPGIVEAQAEGSIIWGLNAALMNKVTIANGAPQQRDFADYPIMRMRDTPEMRIEIAEPRDRRERANRASCRSRQRSRRRSSPPRAAGARDAVQQGAQDSRDHPFEVRLAQRRLRFTLLLMVITGACVVLSDAGLPSQLPGGAAPHRKVAWQRYHLVSVGAAHARNHHRRQPDPDRSVARRAGSAGLIALTRVRFAQRDVSRSRIIPSIALAKPAANVWEAISQRAGCHAANPFVFAVIACLSRHGVRL
jgi:hypothetical protein